jgi:hypothetical protein
MFVICGAVGSALVAAWSLYSTETPEQHPRVTAAELDLIRKGQPPTAKIGRPPWRLILLSDKCRLLMLSYLLVGYTTMFYTWFYLYLVKVRSLPAFEAGDWSSRRF